MSGGDCTKRTFLQALGASVPALKLALSGAALPNQPADAAPVDNAKFTPQRTWDTKRSSKRLPARSGFAAFRSRLDPTIGVR